jgi:multidrug efflux system membrane fusion protein
VAFEMSWFSRFPALLCVLVLPTLTGCRRTEQKTAPPLPLGVFCVQPVIEEVTESEEFTGRTAATQSVELRARVTGYLKEISFEDGAGVSAGQLLFRIDDASFLAEAQRTAASVAQFTTRNDRLSSEYARASELVAKKAISQEAFDTIKYDLDETVASLNAARASHETAKLYVEFTRVTAPLAGRIGRRMIDVGNLVVADETVLATIVPLDKVYVYFDMDERTVLRLRRLENADNVPDSKVREELIDIALADSDAFTRTGTIDFRDNQVDPATGTLRVRAIVDNADALLSPGMFVRVRYRIGEPESALVIPEEAMASEQGRPKVYVVESGDTDRTLIARTRYVEPGPLVGGNRVIKSGLTRDDRVIVTGLQRLRNGTEIRVLEQPSEPESSDTSTGPAGPQTPATAAHAKASAGGSED